MLQKNWHTSGVIWPSRTPLWRQKLGIKPAKIQDTVTTNNTLTPPERHKIWLNLHEASLFFCSLVQKKPGFKLKTKPGSTIYLFLDSSWTFFLSLQTSSSPLPKPNQTVSELRSNMLSFLKITFTAWKHRTIWATFSSSEEAMWGPCVGKAKASNSHLRHSNCLVAAQPGCDFWEDGASCSLQDSVGK